MLNHMLYAHELEDGGISTDINFRIEQQVGSNSNSNDCDDDEHEDLQEDDEEEIQRINENGSSNDTTTHMEVLDNCSGDDTTATANMESIFNTNDENIVVVETVECKPDFSGNDVDGTVVRTSSKSSEKSNDIDSCEYDDDREDDGETITSDVTESDKQNFKNVNVSLILKHSFQ